MGVNFFLRKKPIPGGGGPRGGLAKDQKKRAFFRNPSLTNMFIIISLTLSSEHQHNPPLHDSNGSNFVKDDFHQNAFWHLPKNSYFSFCQIMTAQLWFEMRDCVFFWFGGLWDETLYLMNLLVSQAHPCICSLILMLVKTLFTFQNRLNWFVPAEKMFSPACYLFLIFNGGSLSFLDQLELLHFTIIAFLEIPHVKRTSWLLFLQFQHFRSM